MKIKALRQKYNGLLEKLLRLFTLSGIMFAVTACYGVAPYDYRGYVDVDGDVLDDDGINNTYEILLNLIYDNIK